MGESGLQLALQQIYWPVDRNKTARNLTQKTRVARGDRQQRQVSRQGLHSTCLLVFESKTVSSLLWTGSKSTILCQFNLPPFTRFQRSLQGADICSSRLPFQSFLLTLCSHCLFLKGWGEPESPGAWATFSKIANIEGREAVWLHPQNTAIEGVCLWDHC